MTIRLLLPGKLLSIRFYDDTGSSKTRFHVATRQDITGINNGIAKIITDFFTFVFLPLNAPGRPREGRVDTHQSVSAIEYPLKQHDNTQSPVL